MKKFVIFFLMVFLYLGNCQARNGSTTTNVGANGVFLESLAAHPAHAIRGTVNGGLSGLVDRVFESNTPAKVANTVVVSVDGPERVCVGTTVYLVAQAFTAGADSLMYQWQIDGQYIVGANKQVYSFIATDLGLSTYNVVVSADGCSTVDAYHELIVDEAPFVELTATDMCENGSAVLEANVLTSSSEQPYKWAWFKNDTDDASAFDTTLINTITVTEEGLYYVKALYQQITCDAFSDSARVNAFGTLQPVTMNITDTTVCAGGLFTLAVNGALANNYGTPVYTWYLNNYAIDNFRDSLFTFNPALLGGVQTNNVVRVEVSYPAYPCGILMAEANVNVIPNPTVQIIGDALVCNGTDNVSLTANLNDTLAGVDYSFVWRRDNVNVGTSRDLANEAVAQDAPYIYTVNVSNNENGCVATADYTVYVNNDIQLVVTKTTLDTVCPGEAVTFTANIGGENTANLNYAWTVNGVVIPGAFGQSYTASETAEAKYVYAVTATQAGSQCAATGADSVVVTGTSSQTVALTIAEDVVCEGTQIVLTALPALTGDYVWTWNGVEIAGAHGNTVLATPEVGMNIYGVKLAGSACVTSSANTDTVYVSPNPTVVISGTEFICDASGNNVELTANLYPADLAGTFSYQWLEDNQPIGTDSDTLRVNRGYSDQAYNFAVVVTSDNGCTATGEFSVTVNDSIDVYVTVDHATVCETGEVNLTANLANWNAENLQYQWFRNDTPIYGATSLNYTYTTMAQDVTTPPVFRVEVLQTTSQCAGSDEITINVEPLPALTIAANVTAICDGGAVVLTATPDNNSNVYTWYKNGEILEGRTLGRIVDFPTAQDGDVTSYLYSAQMSTSLPGCVSATTAVTTITVNPNPTVYVQGDPVICSTDSMVLTPHIENYDPNTGSLSYAWKIYATADTTTVYYPQSAANYLNEFSSVFPALFDTELSDEYNTGYISSNTAYGTDQTMNYSEDGLFNRTSGFLSTTCHYEGTSLRSMYGMGEMAATVIGENSGALAGANAANVFITNELGTVLISAGRTAGNDYALNYTTSETILPAMQGGQDAMTLSADAISAFITSALNAAKFNTSDVASSISPVSGTFTQGSSSWNLLCNAAGTDFYTAQQLPAYRAGYNYGYWTAYESGFKNAFISTLLGSNLANHYNDTYVTAFTSSYDVVLAEQITIGGNPFDSLLVVKGLKASENPYRFALTLTSGNGCTTTSDPFYVTVMGAPVVEATSSADTICDGTQVTLTAHLGDYNENDLTYRWFTNDITPANAIYGGTEPWINVTPTQQGDNWYVIAVTNTQSGCVSYDSVNVYVKSVSIALTVTATPDTICMGTQVMLEATSTGTLQGDETYAWYRNGILIEGAEGSIIYDTPVSGNNDFIYVYGVQVSTCTSASVYDTVYVYPNLDVVIDGTPIICTNAPVELKARIRNDYPTANLTYQWYLAGNAIAGATTDTLSYDALYSEHPYTFMVEVKNENGCKVESDPYAVYVNDTLIIEITVDNETVCEGAEVTFTGHLDNPNVPDLTYQWFKNDVAIHGAREITLTTNVMEGDTFMLVVSDRNGGCQMTGYAPALNFLQLTTDVVAINLSSNSHSICDGAQVYVTAYLIDNEGSQYIDTTFNYKWYKNGFLMPLVTGPHFSESLMTVDGDTTDFVYTVRLDIPGCESFYFHDSDTIVVRRNPIVVIEGDHTVCERPNVGQTENVNLFAWTDGIASTDATIRWYRNGQLRSTSSNSYVYNEYCRPNTDPYVFTVEVSSGNGCSAISEPFEVTVHELPNVNITSTETEICQGGEITMTANLDNYNETDMTFQWYKNQYISDSIIPGATRIDYTTTVNQTMNYIVYVEQVTTGCSGFDTIAITVNDRPEVVSIDIDNDTICEGGQVTLSATIQGGVTGGEVYTWYRNNELIAGVTASSFTESPLTIDYDVTNYVYNVVVSQTATGCVSTLDASREVELVVKPNPTVVVVGDPIVCEEGTDNVTLVANVYPAAAAGTYTIQWFEDNAPIANADQDTLRMTKSFRSYPYNFHVVLSNEYGCSVESDMYNVTVNAAPVVYISASETEICEGGEITLSADLDNWNANMLAFQWFADGDSIPGATSLTYTTVVNSTTEFTFKAYQITSQCLATSNAVTVNVNPDPVIASVQISETQICEGGEVTVTAVMDDNTLGVEGSNITYTWYKNGFLMDGVTGASFTESPETIDGDYTSYTYSVYATQDASGCQSEMVASATLNVLANPRVMISGDHHICETDTAFLIANVDTTSRPVGILHYTWYEHGQVRDNMAAGFGDSQFFSEYFYASENPYVFTVEVSRGNGCVALSEEFHLYVHPQPVVNITSNHSVSCVGSEVTLTANLNDYNQEYITYQWFTMVTVNDSVAYATDAEGNYLYNYITTDLYSDIRGATSREYSTVLDADVNIGVRVVQTISGCEAVDMTTLTVYPTPFVEITSVSNTTVCTGGQVTLTATNDYPAELGHPIYTWYKNGEIVSGATQYILTQSPEAIDGDLTGYTYAVKVEFESTGCRSALSVPVTVNAIPTPTVMISANGSLEYCEGGSIVLTANVSPAGVYNLVWYRDNVAVGNGETYTVTDSAKETPYNYHVELVHTAGCGTLSNTVQVNVVPQPNVTIEMPNTVICEGGVTTLTAVVEGGVDNVNGMGQYTYAWYNNLSADILGTDATLTTLPTDAAAVYSYRVIVTSPYGCSVETYSNNLTIVADPIVTIAVATGYDTAVCDGGSTLLQANVTGGFGEVASYQWYKNGVRLDGQTRETLMTGALYYGATDAYTVHITQSGVGCEATSAQYSVGVYPAHQITITGNANVCVGGTITMTAQLVDNLLPGETLSYQWYRIQNGNATAIEGATSAQYTTSELQLGDSYEYYVKATSSISGCTVQSGTVLANVVADPTVVLIAPASVCEGADLVLNAFVNNGIAGVDYTYTWTSRLNGVETQYTTNVPTLTLNSLAATSSTRPYSFTVTITRTDNTGCDATSNSVPVVVVSEPVAEITMDNATICQGGNVTFSAFVTPVGVYNYEWYVNGVRRAGNNTLTVTNLPIGTSDVYVKAIPVNADEICTATSATVHPVVIVNPVVDAVTATVDNMCEGGTVMVSIASVNGQPFTNNNDYSYQWSVNGFEVSGAVQSTFTQTLNTAGTYTYNVRISLNNGLGCSSVWSLNPAVVNVVPQPQITIAAAASGLLDICEGGDVNLTSTIVNNNAVYGNVTYTWYASGIPTGITTAALTHTPSAVGTYNYYVVANFDGIACSTATSNVITVNVNAVPSWTTVQVVTPNGGGNICAGERVELIADIQGGVQDATGNTSGIVQWYVKPEGGVETPVSGGVGAISYDYPQGDGNFSYIVRYDYQLGLNSGCAIEAGIPYPDSAVTVHPLPIAYFTAGEGSIICANDPEGVVELEITFEGTAPFSFMLQNTTTGQNTAYSGIYQNPYVVYVRPNVTSTYMITNLNDAFCSASDNPGTAVTTLTVAVSNVEIPSAFTMDCDAVIGTDGNPTLVLPITILSGFPTIYSVTFVNEGLSSFNVVNAAIQHNAQGYYLEFPVTGNPGTYGMVVEIDGCSYYVSLTVPVLGNNLAGHQLIDMRWDDVVVVNNNPSVNGGYTFLTYQWYKNGEIIPGATSQYYNEVGGLDGYYSVTLTYVDNTTGEIVEITTCAVNCLNTNTMKIYPVPAAVNQPVVIETGLTDEELQGAILDIFDAKGAHVQRVSTVQSITVIDGFKAQGTYFGRIVTSDNQIKAVKFVVAK